MMTFGLAITIPESEKDICNQFVRPAFVVLGLTNDLFSWEKEYQSAMQRGMKNVPNAIWVLMQQHAMDLAQAKQLCRKIIKQNVSEYLEIVRKNMDNKNLSPDLRRYLDAIQYTLSGNALWSLESPRYRLHDQHDTSQNSMMHTGLAQNHGENTNYAPVQDNPAYDLKTPAAPQAIESNRSIGSSA